jgi:hypothetical protein
MKLQPPTATSLFKGSIAALLAIALLGSCKGSQSATSVDTTQPQPLDTRAFRHDQHLAMEQDGKKLSCEACHTVLADQKFQTKRPGSNEHAPCDSCHAAEYMKAPGEFCKTCHASVDALKKGNSPLADYPRQQGRAQLLSSFNHQTHIERAKDRIKEGGQFACEACHVVKDKESAYATFPVHPDCAFCHADVARPKMKECSGCHAEDGPAQGRKFLGNDIRFTHGKHREDAAGKRIDCVVCHSSVPESTKSSELNLPKMKSCAVCHEDSSKTPDRVRISQCGVCHLSDVQAVTLPGNHTASIETPGAGHARVLSP